MLLKIRPSNRQLRTVDASSSDCTYIRTNVNGHLLAVVPNQLMHFDEDGNHLHVISS